MRYLYETLDLIRKGKLSPLEHFQEIEERLKDEEDIHSFITLDVEKARRNLATRNKDGMLYGAVVGVKDNIQVKSWPMTCASKILENYESVFDADVATALDEEGALILGKLNMDEFAMGSSNETSYFGPTKNPIDRRLVPGGSSGGSAAAVGMGFVDVSLGTDTGGSVRQPASFCSVVGLKPTYGAVSRYGVTSLANTLDTVGTLGRSVRDAYLLLQAIAKDTKRDMTKIHVDLDDLCGSDDEAMEQLKGKTIAMLRNINGFGMDKEVREAYEASLSLLEKAGCTIIEEDFKYIDYVVGCYYSLMDAEASSNLSRFDGIRYGGVDYEGTDYEEYMTKVRSEGFGREVKRRILAGMYILSSAHKDAYFEHALKVRRAISEDYDRILGKCDAILSPTAIGLPFALGEKVESPSKMMEGDLLSVPANMAGLPAISVPSTGKRIINAGMQFTGRKRGDRNLCNIALGYEGLVKER
ncbi:MAG: Asp-tRNA(Asn)/Glu-tRNA(Gln) amidotransferase subunit GatA [Tissierellia bacterium]|nr:Asp-tRNA(Asn)/Glu-tRNA(Gln) amidotransferase subunit GatA [Tissierellia bacterium]